MQPRPESRLSTLEKRASALEASVEERASDTAEELKAIRQTIDANFTELKQDIKQLSDGITDSYKSIGDTFVAPWDDIKPTQHILDIFLSSVMADETCHPDKQYER